MENGRVRGSARAAALVAAVVFLGSCGGGQSGPPIDVACENALMQADGSIILPSVAADGGTFQYVLSPMSASDGVRRYQSTRSQVAGTPSCAFSVADGGVLQTDGIQRIGQTVSISLQASPDSADTFAVTSARTRSGNLDGFAGGDKQLVGATVTVKSAAGATLQSGTTNQYGAIESEIGPAGLPDTFRVVATGGTIDGEPLGGSLVADVTDYSAPFSAVVTATPVTTLVSAWRDRNPQLSRAEAMAAVRTFLQFPDAQEMDSDHEASESYFDTAAFYAQARAAGGIDAFVQALTGEWASGTQHAFVPPEPDRDDTLTSVEKAMLPDQIVPPGVPQRANVGAAQQPQSIEIVASIIGKVWESYDKNQTKQFQADTISSLARIERRLSDLKSRVDNNLLATVKGDYATKMIPMKVFEGKVRAAFDAFRLLAMYPNATAATKAQRIEAMKNLTNGSFFSISPGFATELEGSFVSNETSDGAFNLYRKAAYLRTTAPVRAGTQDPLGYRNLFSYADSWAMWDNYQYWIDIQVLGYYFWSEKYRGSNQFAELDGDGEIEGLTPRFNRLLVAERAEMPRWALNSGAHLDARGEDYYGNPAVGPLVWFVAGIFGNQCASDPITFDAGNNQVRSLINARLNCFNSPAHLGGVGGWRLPTFKEWEVFTLTAGSPGRDVGAWLEERGVIHAKDMNGKFFYAQIGTSCSDPVVADKYNQTCLSGGVNIYFANKDSEGHIIFPPGCGTRCTAITTNYWYSDYYQGSWEPFLWFNQVHKPGAWRESNYKGYVIPVRAAATNDFL